MQLKMFIELFRGTEFLLGMCFHLLIPFLIVITQATIKLTSVSRYAAAGRTAHLRVCSS